VRAAFERATELGDVVRQAGALSARTLIFDVEPLVAYWDSDQEALDQGIARVLGEIAVLPAVQVVCRAARRWYRPELACKWSTWRRRASQRRPRRTGVFPGQGW
jgi:hypothetical protein